MVVLSLNKDSSSAALLNSATARKIYLQIERATAVETFISTFTGSV